MIKTSVLDDKGIGRGGGYHCELKKFIPLGQLFLTRSLNPRLTKFE